MIGVGQMYFFNYNYPQEDMSYDRLREVVRAAWDAVSEEYLQELIIRLVIEANGQCIKA